MPITIPQTNQNSAGTGTSLAVSFGSGIAAGSIIVVATGFDSTQTVSLDDGHGDTVTDSGLGIVTDGGVLAAVFKAFLTPTTGAITVTATYSGSTFSDIFIWEVAGLTSPQFDKAVFASGTAATADSGSSGTLSSSNEACFGYCATEGQAFTTAGSGWTSDGVTTNTGSIGEHQIVSSNTALHATAPAPTGTWLALFASLMSGGGTAVPDTLGNTIFKPTLRRYY